MSLADLERILKDLRAHGTLIKDRPSRQVWRFEAGGKGYYLKFYPRLGSRLKRMIRGNPAMREFVRMQALQRAKVPSPRAVAVLSGYTIGEVKGDAVISEAIEPSVTLDRYLNDFELAGTRAPDHLELSRQVREIVNHMGREMLGHDDLHLGNFLRDADGKVHLLDAYAVTFGGVKMEQILRLGHSVARYATRMDIVRAWNLLAPGSPMPRGNKLSPRIWRKFVALSRGDNRYFGHVESGGWTGVAFRQWKYPARWSPASQLNIDPAEWERIWPGLLAQLDGGNELESLKSSRSGDVVATRVILGGREIDIVIKRPLRKKWWRYINEIGRGSRAARAWTKAWSLITRNIPTAWPLLLMEKKVLGYTTDQVIICERVCGSPLATTDLDAIAPVQRDALFRRCGRILGRIEQSGLCHFDSKSSNWIVRPDDRLGPTPILVDVDGVRFYRWDTFGIHRLLRSMREHAQYTPADSLALCQGYAPFTLIDAEEPAAEAGRRTGAEEASDE